MEDEESRTVWVGNFNPEDVTQEILYELFLQAGPLYYVKIPKDRNTGRLKNFAFVCYRHSVTVPYAIELLDGITVYGRDLKVQSRNHQHLQRQGLASGPGGIHTLDPDFGKISSPCGPPQPCGQQALMQTPSLLGMPGNNMMAMAQQQMTHQQMALQQMPHQQMAHQQMTHQQMAQQKLALLNAFQPIPLSANPLLNAPRERYSDRHGSLSYNRNSPYQSQRGNYSNDHRSNHSNSRDSPYSSHNSQRNSKDKVSGVGDTQHTQGRFDYSRLGPPPGRNYNSPHSNDHYKRQDDRYDRQRSGSHQSHHNTPRRHDDHHDRRQTDRHSGRNYRH